MESSSVLSSIPSSCEAGPYNAETYLSPVDLSQQALSKYVLSPKDADPKKAALAKTAQKLISIPEVQALLSQPLTYDPDRVAEINAQLEKHGFVILGVKPLPGKDKGNSFPFYGVMEHPSLPGWVFRVAAEREQNGKPALLVTDWPSFDTPDDGLLRLSMAKRVEEVAKANKVFWDVVVPRTFLVEYENVGEETERSKRYCLLCEKIDVCTAMETGTRIAYVDKKTQKMIARKIARIVWEGGLVDASLRNIRLTNNRFAIAFIDTEPTGLMVAQPSDGSTSRGASVEYCGRSGVFHLLQDALYYNKVIHAATSSDGTEGDSDAPTLDPFCEQLGQECVFAHGYCQMKGI